MNVKEFGSYNYTELFWRLRFVHDRSGDVITQFVEFSFFVGYESFLQLILGFRVED